VNPSEALEILEILPGNMILNDQGDIVLSLVVVDHNGRRWAGFAVGNSDNVDAIVKRAIASALGLRSLYGRSASREDIEAQGVPREEARESLHEALPRENPSPNSESPEDEGKKKALKYLRALWAEARRRGVDPTQVTGRATVEEFQDLPLEELREVYKLLYNALRS